MDCRSRLSWESDRCLLDLRHKEETQGTLVYICIRIDAQVVPYHCHHGEVLRLWGTNYLSPL